MQAWIRTERLVLRPFELTDVDRLVLLTQDSSFRTPWGVFKEPMDRERALEWVLRAAESMKKHGLGNWAVMEHGHVVGMAALLPRWPDGESTELLAVEYRLLRSAWGRGLATEAILGLIDYGHREKGYETFHAFIPPDNLMAKNVAFKAGMTFWRRARIDDIPVEIYRTRVTDGHPSSRFASERVA